MDGVRDRGRAGQEGTRVLQWEMEGGEFPSLRVTETNEG